MTNTITVAKLFADARLGVAGISGRTDHFVGLDIAGQSFNGTLLISRHMRRRTGLWNCVITARHDTRSITLCYSFQGKDAEEALGKVERKLLEDATVMVRTWS